MLDNGEIAQFHRELTALCTKFAHREGQKSCFIKKVELDYRFTKITFGLLDEINESAPDNFETDVVKTFQNKWEEPK